MNQNDLLECSENVTGDQLRQPFQHIPGACPERFQMRLSFDAHPVHFEHVDLCRSKEMTWISSNLSLPTRSFIPAYLCLSIVTHSETSGERLCGNQIKGVCSRILYKLFLFQLPHINSHRKNAHVHKPASTCCSSGCLRAGLSSARRLFKGYVI